MSPNAQNVAAVIVAMLKDVGVDRVYGVSGESYLPLLDELGKSTIDVITNSHEGGAGLMAVADAKLTGRLSVCMVSRGPGAANSAIGMVAAQEDNVPLILLVGQVPKSHLRRDAFQELDYSKFFSGTAKWSAEISDPSRVADIMSRAIHTACGGTPGPVVIALPEDVLGEAVELIKPAAYRPFRALPEPATLDEVVALLKAAKKPLFIVGGELANDSGRAALVRATEAWNVPVLVSFRRLDLFPNDHPLFASELGFFNKPEQLAAFNESDLILAVGTRLTDLTTQGFAFPRSPQPKQDLVHVHRDPAVIGRNYVPRVGLNCDATMFLDSLTKLAPAGRPSRGEWPKRLHDMRVDAIRWAPATANDGVVFGNVIAALEKHIAPDAIFAMDAGINAAMLYRHHVFTRGQTLLTPITGTMGWGIPAATAAALRYPKRQVICLIGDGGFLMGGNELAVAATTAVWAPSASISNASSPGAPRPPASGHPISQRSRAPTVARRSRSMPRARWCRCWPRRSRNER
jgi:acetolactate synthase-1/2/3 large subunit